MLHNSAQMLVHLYNSSPS